MSMNAVAHVCPHIGCAQEHFSRTYFLFFDSYSQARDKGFSANYLWIGDDPSECAQALEKRVISLYQESLRLLRSYFMRAGQTPWQFEVLHGHLILAIVKKVILFDEQISYLPTDLKLQVCKGEGDLDFRVTNSTMDAMRLLLTDGINEHAIEHVLFARKKISVPASRLVLLEPPLTHQRRTTFLELLYIAISTALRPATRRNKIAIVSSYVGRRTELFLNLSLHQLPFLTEVRSRMIPGKFSKNSRSPLKWAPSTEPLIMAVAEIFRVLAPYLLLEGFEGVSSRLKERGWPVRADVIFTSGSFATDDEFKIFLSEKLHDCKYVVGQHGNNYFVRPLTGLPELRTCDTFVSWGWSGKKANPLGILKPKPKHRRKIIPAVVLVLRDDMFVDPPLVDVTLANDIYLRQVHSLIEALSNLGIPVIIKPHPYSSEKFDHWIEDMQAKHRGVSRSNSNLSIEYWRKQGHFPVFTYDATPMLELAATGNPFFYFAAEGLGHIRRQYLKNYRVLREQNLLAAEPSEAAQLIGKILSKEISFDAVQIRKFLDGIAHSGNCVVTDLRRLLIDMRTKSKSKGLPNT